ncbi:hypothetical protein [Streptomyces lunalinharesii]|uniref:Uncharacterized protein n=1 Tax=Streptomyces lunalinharesii TaxID=333384 RepID=A0ABP6FAJ3_9ACTN
MTTNDRWIDRFIIDDGRHLPEFVIVEDASTAAGAARYQVACSCGRMPKHAAGTQDEALATHMAHVQTKVGPSKGPKWLPEGARVALLAAAMMVGWGACYAAGNIVVADQALTGAAAKTVLGGAVLLGFTLDFALMVATRRYIAPTRT